MNLHAKIYGLDMGVFATSPAQPPPNRTTPSAYGPKAFPAARSLRHIAHEVCTGVCTPRALSALGTRLTPANKGDPSVAGAKMGTGGFEPPTSRV
jgi:hypothetical protein